MALPVRNHDCTRIVELQSFIECERPQVRSGWFLDRYFRTRFTEAEKLELRRYSYGNAKPLFYSGACEPPNIVKPLEQSVRVDEMNWPVIKAETQIDGCYVDDMRVTPDGRVLGVGGPRYRNASNWAMMSVMESLRATHIQEAIHVLKTGGYVLHTDVNGGSMGTVDFGRDDSLKYIDVSGVMSAEGDWTGMCAKPLKLVEGVLREMSRCGGASGTIDIIYSQLAWDYLEAHEERESIKYSGRPSVTSMGFDETPFLGYNDVQFKGNTNGGVYAHWVSNAQFIDYDGVLKPILAPGEIMIVSRAGFDGQRVFRTVTSDNRERLPEGATYFLYDDPSNPEVYSAKCRAYRPWIEEYHLMVPQNVNGATVVRVVPEDAEGPCVACEACPTEETGTVTTP